MARNFQNMFVIILLCVGILFITGIALPKYVSEQYFKLRTAMNSSSNSLKFILNADVVPTNRNIENLNNANQSFTSKLTEESQFSSLLNDTLAGSLQTSKKDKKRFKRRASEEEDNELVVWNFNVNVTRYKNKTSQEATKNDYHTAVGDKRVAVYVDGEGSRQTAFSELQNALKFVGTFLKNIFDGNIESGTDEHNEKQIVQSFKGILYAQSELETNQNPDIRDSTANKRNELREMNDSQIVQSVKGSLKTKAELETTQNAGVKFDNMENKNESLIQKGREGKFLFGIFKLGVKDINKITQSSEAVVTTGATEDNTEIGKNNFGKESLHDNTFALKSEFVTENLQKAFGLHSESRMSEFELPATEFNEDSNMQELVGQQGGCSDCTMEALELIMLSNKMNVTSENGVLETTTHPNESLFTDEILKKVCMNLVNRLEESQKLSSVQENGLDSEFNDQNVHNQLKSPPNLIDIFSLLSELKERISETESAVIEDSFLVSSDEATTESMVLTERRSRFFNLNMFGFGSGRSAVIEEIDSTSDVLEAEIIEENLPSILDCKSYFRQKQNIKMFSKPNLMDMISDPKIKLTDFINTTISPELKEQNLQFLTDLLTDLRSSIETFDNATRDVETYFGDESKIVFESGSNFTTNKNETFITKNKEISQTEANHRSANSDVRQTTEEQRNGRIFNIFGFGSGNQEERNISESRWFLDSFFGSGERSLEILHNENELDGTNDFGSRDSIQVDATFSGDARILNTSDGLFEHFNTTAVQDPRFLGFGVIAGSRNGRGLTVNTEFVETKTAAQTDKDCVGNCNHEFRNTAENSYDCGDYECDFERPLDHENAYSTEFPNDVLSNESDCHSDCYPDMELHEGNKVVESNLTGDSSNYDSKVLTADYFPEDFENCNCFDENNFTEGNGTFSECGECNLKEMQISDERNATSERDLSTEKLSKNVSETKLKEVYENDCNNCNQEKDLLYEKEISVTFTDFGTLKPNYNDANTMFTHREVKSSIVTSFRSDAGIDSDIDDNGENATHMPASDVTENLYGEQKTTEIKSRHFMGTIFLTGSGEGGLFGNDGGTINLVEEESTISHPIVFPRRRGRLDDTSDTLCDNCELEYPDLLQKSNSNEIVQDNSTVHHLSSSSPKINTVNNISTFVTKGSKVDETALRTNMTETEDITSSFEEFTSSLSDLVGVSKTELQPRFCISASECSSTLNERCITRTFSSICDCGRTFVRHKETGKCVVKRLITPSLKLPGEVFNSDFKNPESPRFKQKSEESNNMMWLLLKDAPELLPIVAEVNIADFNRGSLIITWNLVLAVENESEERLIQDMKDELQRALKNGNLIEKVSLNIRNASVLSITSTINPCISTELNYCSENAYCIWNETYPGRFVCSCKERYLDVSSNIKYPGETCTDKCSPSYCGFNGHCEILENEKKHCLCNGLYFGERCEVSEVVILVILSVGALISVTVLVAVASRKRCRTRSYGRTPTFRRSEEIGMHPIANGRVSDAIALERNVVAKVAKFSHISAEMQEVPVIRVTRPTLNESSISFDCDSSFDVTPTSV